MVIEVRTGARRRLTDIRQLQLCLMTLENLVDLEPS